MTDFRLEPTTHVGAAARRFEDLATSTNHALGYVESGPGTLKQVDGRIWMLASGGHQDFVGHTERNIQRGKQLLEAARDALDAVQERYDSTEEDHLVGVADLFADIGGASSSEPLADHGTTADYGTSLPAHEIPPAENFEGIPDWAIMMMEFGGSFVFPHILGDEGPRVDHRDEPLGLGSCPIRR